MPATAVVEPGSNAAAGSTTGTGTATAVDRRRWPVPEERRTVSVLFVDIVGSTALVERLDPEEVRALQRAYFDTVAAVLRRWDGVVEKYVGDAVMALFGAVTSDGFDAYRAVRAGLEIQRTLDGRPLAGGTAVRLRVGVASGEALVDLTAACDGGHAAVSGAVATLAARLQTYAPSGAVVACATTRRATAELIGYRALPPVTVVGKELPVDVWRAEGPVPVRPARGGIPLFGRRRELAALHDQLVRAVRDRAPRWVSLVGPDGIGRSRLLDELASTVRQVDGAPVRWCRAQCPPYPQDPLAPLRELVRDLAGNRADADRCGDGPRAWREILLVHAARQPMVVAVDDVDRAGPEVNRFLHELHATATARELPLVVLVTYRPEWADVLPLGPADRQHRLVVPPLGTVESGRLLRHLLGDAATVTRLLPLVGGNPGHAHAWAAQVGADAGPGEPTVPDQVRRAASARLDRYDGTARAVLMAGAALGGGFTVDDLARLLDLSVELVRPALRELVARRLLVWRPARQGYEVADRTLARVAYERLPRTVRADFQRRAAPAGDEVRPVRLVGVPAHPAAARQVSAVAPGEPTAATPRLRPAAPPPRYAASA